MASFTHRADRHSPAVPAPPPTPDGVAAALDRAGAVGRAVDRLLGGLRRRHPGPARRTTRSPHPTRRPAARRASPTAAGAGTSAPDEALLIEHDEPDAHYWNWSIHHLHWFDSGDWDQRLDELQRPPGPRRRRRPGAPRRRPRRPGRPQLARHRGPTDRHGRLPLRRRRHQAPADGARWSRSPSCAARLPDDHPGRARRRRAAASSPTGHAPRSGAGAERGSACPGPRPPRPTGSSA